MARKLSDIWPGNGSVGGEGVSLVKRGANRRTFLLSKDGEVEFDETIAKILDEPAKDERAMLDAVEKAGGDEEVLHAVSAFARLREALPAEVLKSVTQQMQDAEDEEDALDGGDDEDAEGEGDGEEIEKAAQEYETLLKRDFTDEQRKKLADSGAALPNGSYPIENTADLKNAIHAVGRGKAPHAEIRAHIKARAKALGAEDQLPESWNVSKEEDMSETAMPVKKEDGWDLSGVSDEARAAVEAVLKSAEDEKAELIAKAEAEATKAENAERIAKEVREEITKSKHIEAARGYENLAKSADELGELLYEIAKAEKDEHLPKGTSETLTELLKAANEASASVFKEAGRVGHGTGGDAEAKVEKAADDLRAADPSLTKEQAFAKALDNDPSLYDEIRKEQA